MNDMSAPARLLMNFEVTPTSHLLAEYQARGGYKAIEKAIRTMTPNRSNRPGWSRSRAKNAASHMR